VDTERVEYCPHCGRNTLQRHVSDPKAGILAWCQSCFRVRVLPAPPAGTSEESARGQTKSRGTSKFQRYHMHAA